MSQQLQLKEKYQVLPAMPPEQFEALKADIAQRGVLTPIDVDEDGHILDGHNRYRACLELGITDFPTIVRPGMSEEDRRMFARKSNMLRRQLSREQVRQLIAEQLKDTPNWANSRIAQALGVDDKTVKTVRDELEATSEIPMFTRLIGADGKERPTKRPGAVMAPNVEELKKILERLADGGTVEEFAAGADVIVLPGYDPFAGFSKAEIRKWKLFILFGATGYDPQWLLRKNFKTPDEWIGEDGAKWRKFLGVFCPRTEARVAKGWMAFCEKHKDTPGSELDVLLSKQDRSR